MKGFWIASEEDRDSLLLQDVNVNESWEMLIGFRLHSIEKDLLITNLTFLMKIDKRLHFQKQKIII